MAEDGGGQPASNRQCWQYGQNRGFRNPGIWLGDADTRPSRGAMRGTPLVEGYPSAFVVRTADMKVITHQGLSQYVLPFAQIVNHLDVDWSNPGAPELPSNCGEEDEEDYEPNDEPNQAATIEAGGFDGGICDNRPDFYLIDIRGDWQLDLEFSHGMGDLDVYVFDPDAGEQGDVVTDINGNPIGSYGTDDDESFQHRGEEMVIVVGYNGATAPYTLTLTEL